MAEIIEDRVMQTTTSTGTGVITVSTNVAGYKAFSAVCSIGDTFHAAIVAVDASGAPTGDWETGYYTYSAANTITRTTVRTSSATSNAAVNFAAGTKQVFLDLSAYQIRNFGVTSSSPSASPFGQTASAYTSLTFADEFGSTIIDTSKWKNNLTGGTNNATQNFSAANGNLNIWPQIDGTSSFFDRDFTTDVSQVTPGFSQQYGFFEIEMRLPQGAGLHPVFSLYNNDGHEIRIVNAYCGAPNGNWSTTDMHPKDWAMTVLTNQTTSVSDYRASNFITPPDMSLAFHKYGVRWDATTVKFYFDGTQVGTTVSHTTMTSTMYMYLGLRMATNNETTAITGSGALTSGNRYTPQGATNSMQINYIRAWQIAS